MRKARQPFERGAQFAQVRHDGHPQHSSKIHLNRSVHRILAAEVVPERAMIATHIKPVYIIEAGGMLGTIILPECDSEGRCTAHR